MKICTKCKSAKTIDLFVKRSVSKDGLSSWCKECFAIHASQKYKNEASERERKRRNKENTKAKNLEYIYNYLKDKQCIDCGFSNWLALEFDHQGNKEFNVSEGLLYSLDRVKKEIEKCEIRCANCHRIKTALDFNTWRSKI